MFFVYLLALIGLAFLIMLAADAVLRPPRDGGAVVSDDPYEVALGTAAQLQEAAWKAADELRALDESERRW